VRALLSSFVAPYFLASQKYVFPIWGECAVHDSLPSIVHQWFFALNNIRELSVSTFAAVKLSNDCVFFSVDQNLEFFIFK